MPTLSERLTPPQVVAVLNEFFAVVVACVHERGGILDKFIGDAAPDSATIWRAAMRRGEPWMSATNCGSAASVS